MQAQPKLKILIQYNENAKVLKMIIQSAIYILSLMKSISLHHMQTESIIIIQVNFVILVSTSHTAFQKYSISVELFSVNS